MATKTKKGMKSVKATAKKVTAKAPTAANRSVKTVQTSAKNSVAKAKASAKPTAKKVSPNAKTQTRKRGGFIQNVKDGIHSGMEAMREMLKKITPDALLRDSAKSK